MSKGFSLKKYIFWEEMNWRSGWKYMQIVPRVVPVRHLALAEGWQNVRFLSKNKTKLVWGLTYTNQGLNC